MKTLLMVLAAIPVAVSAQWLHYPTAGVPKLPDGSPNLAAPAPRTPDGKPDFSGIWMPSMRNTGPEGLEGQTRKATQFWDYGIGLPGGLPYQSWARDLRNTREAANSKDNPDVRCMPLGLLQMLTHPMARRVQQSPGYIAILYERNSEFRQIFTDGRPLPVDPQPSWNGYSTGRWDGDTLVVETNGLRDGLWADYDGSPTTEAAKVTERYRRVNYGNLEIDVTVDDPKAYTKPWTIKVRHAIALNTDLLEYFCLENEKDTPHLVGK
jgi:hypothetical protein